MQQPNGGTSPADINAIFATDRDRGADTAAPAERQEQPRQEAPAQVPPPEAAPVQPASDENSSDAPRHVPLSELLAERKKRQETERLMSELQGRAAAYEQQFAHLNAQRQYQPAHPQQQQPQLPEQAPDPVVDPQGFQHWINATVNGRTQEVYLAAQSQFLNLSKSHAANTYGYQAVQAAEQFAAQHNVLGQFASQPDPYGALVQWFNSAQVLNQIGGDFAGYQERLRKEGADRALAELNKGRPPQGGNGQPQQQPRFPTTLADQTAAGQSQGNAPQSGSAMINAMFSPDRNRKAF